MLCTFKLKTTPQETTVNIRRYEIEQNHVLLFGDSNMYLIPYDNLEQMVIGIPDRRGEEDDGK